MTDDELVDAMLLARTIADDQSALAIILRRHTPSVTRYAWALVGTRADVEEVVQDTFLTYWRKASSISLPDHSLLPWLLVTCRNISMNLNRARFRHSTEQLSGDLLVTEPYSSARDRLRWVLAEIEKLNPIDRGICEMCLVHGGSYADAAEEVGISVGAVGQRVSRSRERLRKAVTDDEN